VQNSTNIVFYNKRIRTPDIVIWKTSLIGAAAFDATVDGHVAALLNIGAPAMCANPAGFHNVAPRRGQHLIHRRKLREPRSRGKERNKPNMNQDFLA
jgi:hypothetical protein